MSLVAEIIALALSMACFSALPLLFERVRRHSRPLFLTGTGAMLSICFFDLVPDLLGDGGWTAALVMACSTVAYSLVHSLHFFHHEHDPEEVADHCHYGTPRTFVFFMGPLIGHGIASGMLLAVSRGLSSRMASGVFVALLAHKAYESLLLASILVGVRKPLGWKLRMIALYASALPAGALLTTMSHESISTRLAMLISGIAVGTLLGCLFFDFLLPSLRQLRERRTGAAWIAAGFVLTRIMMMRH